MELCKVGKVKKVYKVSPEELEFEFTDQISVFDKIIPTSIPRKGETLCKTSAFWFERAHTMKIPTHFIRYIPPDRMRVSRVSIIETPTPKDSNYLIPLEVIARYYVAGSFYDRIKAKDRREPESSTLGYGDELPEPHVEVTTKLERVDRLLTEKEALEISGLSKEEYEHMVEITLKVDEDINREVRKRGLIHVDGKKEFALDGERKIMIVDTYGTADEDRFWDLNSYEHGECIEKSKEFVRSYYRSVGYHDALYAARAQKEPEPDIPPLPADMVEKTSLLYRNLYYQLTGVDVHEG